MKQVITTEKIPIKIWADNEITICEGGFEELRITKELKPQIEVTVVLKDLISITCIDTNYNKIFHDKLMKAKYVKVKLEIVEFDH
jgi:hypothetical protein